VIHQNKEVFGEDADVFRPERYLGATEEELQAMERANLAWGLGGRVCLGRHIAELEIKMVIPTLLLAFDVSWNLLWFLCVVWV
jgi:cytochrome P450